MPTAVAASGRSGLPLAGCVAARPGASAARPCLTSEHAGSSPRTCVSAVLVEPERVYRFYRGGRLLAALGGRAEEDGSYPEAWIGSDVAARNPSREEPFAGLARLANGRLLREAIAGDPVHWLGRPHLERYGPTTGLLVKLLDAAERLPVHAHPSRRFAREHLGSQFGKTECWFVLGTRGEHADVWLGLTEAVEPRVYRSWIEEQRTTELL